MTIPHEKAMNASQLAEPTLRRTMLDGSSKMMYGGLTRELVTCCAYNIAHTHKKSTSAIVYLSPMESPNAASIPEMRAAEI